MTKQSLSSGERQSVRASIQSDKTVQAFIVMELYDPEGDRVSRLVQKDASFVAGKAQTFQANWTVPTNPAKGTYTLSLAIYSKGQGSLWSLNESAASFTVR